MGIMFLNERGVPPGEVITDEPPKPGREGGAALNRNVCVHVYGYNVHNRRVVSITQNLFGSHTYTQFIVKEITFIWPCI